jgi:predicted transcriptional regulator
MPVQWSPKDTTTILTLLARNAGNVAKTIREVKEDLGRAPDRDTLANWRDRKHAEQYARIRDELSREFEADAVRTLRDRMRQAADAEELAITAMIEALQQGRVSNRDLAGVAFSMSKIKATNADRLLTLTGRPTQIIDDRSAQKVIEGLVRRKVLRIVKDDEDAA